MKLRSVILGLAMTGLVPACVRDRDSLDQREISEVEAVAHALMAADSARDVRQVAELYAPDAVMLPPGEEPVVGISEIHPRYEAFFRTHAPALRFLIEESVVVGDLAYVRGRTRGTIHDLAGLADQPINDVFLMILRQSTDGMWHISRLMWHAAGTEG